MTLAWIQADQTILFESRHKEYSKPMNEFKILRRSIPTIKQDRLGLHAFLPIGPTQQVAKGFVLRQPIGLWRIDPKVNGIISRLRAMEY